MKKKEYKAPTAVIYELDVESNLMLAGSGFATIGDGGGTSPNSGADAKRHNFVDEYDEFDESNE